MTSSIGGKADGNGFHMLASTGALTATVSVPSDGKYKIRTHAMATQGGDEDARMALQINGEMVQEFEVKGHKKPAWFEHELTLTAGTHAIAGAFLNDYYQPDAPEDRRDRNLAIHSIEVIGPEGGGAPAWHETHRRFVTVRPSDTVTVKEAATQVLRPILYRVFRRPVTEVEVMRFAELVNRNVTEFRETFDYGLYVALQAALVSPDFLFRKEGDPEGDAAERKLEEAT